MIRSVWFENFGPFRGRHVIRLGSKAYAVTCRYEADPGRSNWGGKSMLMEGIDFALTGRLKKSRRFDADGWITRGEKHGLVGVVLEDGHAIVRSRRRGKATQVRAKKITEAEADYFFIPALPDAIVPHGVATQDAAEAAMLKHLGFDADDFRHVAYFESKQMARLVHTDPAAREDIVSGWLGTRKADEAEEAAGRLVADRVRAADAARSSRSTLAEMLAKLPEFTPDAVAAAEARVTETNEKVRAASDALSNQRAAAEAYKRAAHVVAEYDTLVEEGKKVAAEIEAFPVDLDKKIERINEEWETVLAVSAETQGEVVRREQVARGEFDGRCPIADIECPVRKKINEDRKASVSALKVAQEQADIVTKQVHETGKVKKRYEQQFSELASKEQSLEHLRARARVLHPEVKSLRAVLKKPPLTSSDELSDALYEAQREHRAAIEARAEMKSHIAQREKLVHDIANIDANIRQIAEEAKVALQTRAVLRTATRRVSERALATISALASTTLTLAGVDLKVEVRWEYEGKDLAKSCDECGAAFPHSAKVKVCEHCGAARGQNVIRRLDFVRSDQSDAADDLAGVALQLAAGSWLLNARQSPWATAMLDEPLAACDKTNRRALAHQLVRLLGMGTWRQSLVISHSNDTVDVFPGKIEVVVERDGTRRIEQR